LVQQDLRRHEKNLGGQCIRMPPWLGSASTPAKGKKATMLIQEKQLKTQPCIQKGFLRNFALTILKG